MRSKQEERYDTDRRVRTEIGKVAKGIIGNARLSLTSKTDA
jgi:hypothetical protein